jgi:hypothetical protein
MYFSSTLVDWFLGLAYACRKFFHPSEIDHMLETILPRLDGTNMSVSTYQEKKIKSMVTMSTEAYARPKNQSTRVLEE